MVMKEEMKKIKENFFFNMFSDILVLFREVFYKEVMCVQVLFGVCEIEINMIIEQIVKYVVERCYNLF